MSPNNEQPIRLAITPGDPAGVGPEIVLALFAEGGWPDGVVPFVAGNADVLEQVRVAMGLPGEVVRVDAPPDASPAPGVVPVVETRDFAWEGDVKPGRISAENGAAAWAAVREAVALIDEGKADGVVTAPLHKEALHAAGCPHPGHTELLAELAGGREVAMLLVGGGVRVALATIHVPVGRVPSLLNPEGILSKLRLMHTFIPWFGLRVQDEVTGEEAPAGGEAPRFRAPRIAVAGLNPHAGEGGMFGIEERRVIGPAIDMARREAIDAIGPVPGDTVFHFQREGSYDAVLAMYHDQGLVAVKTLDFHRGVNVTMGLPFIRTSVDHGTAFDIAGRGTARPDSLRSAFETAALLTRNRRLAEA